MEPALLRWVYCYAWIGLVLPWVPFFCSRLVHKKCMSLYHDWHRWSELGPFVPSPTIFPFLVFLFSTYPVAYTPPSCSNYGGMDEVPWDRSSYDVRTRR
jgi:hypothetical protein